jgi:hypothetical protein
MSSKEKSMLNQEQEQYLEEIVGKYIKYKKIENENKSKAKEIADEVDEILHELTQNSVEVYLTALDKIYECKYVDRKNKKVDYVRLAEVVSEAIYDEIVQAKESTYLKISAKAMKKSEGTRKKPVAEVSNDLPTGTIMK